MNVVEWINTNTYVKLELLLFKPDSDTTEKETNVPFFFNIGKAGDRRFDTSENGTNRQLKWKRKGLAFFFVFTLEDTLHI
jgi:hypothetical protein